MAKLISKSYEQIQNAKEELLYFKYSIKPESLDLLKKLLSAEQKRRRTVKNER